MSDLQYALDRMSTALDASRLSCATADEDARCMAIIRAEIERLTAALRHEADCVEAAKAEIERLTAENAELRRQLAELRIAYNAACDALRS